MRTDIWIDKKAIDLYSDTSIKYTFQVNDIANLSNRQSTYTNSFTGPKTPNNVQIMDGLGLPSDTSRIPYLKPDCKMKHEGFDLIKKGWMNVTETDENYRFYLYSGLINFFKAIENKTLGDDLDLSEINHTKDITSVVNSYLPGSPYKYFLADYNGQTHFLNNPNIINIDYLVPSVNVKYLWDKIHSKFNFPYVGDIFNDDDFKNLFITYPKAPNIADLYKLISSGHNVQYLFFGFAGAESPATKHKRLFVNNIDPGSAVWRNGQYLDIVEDGTYKIYLDAITVGPGGDPWPNTNYWLGINSEGIEPQNITNKLLLVNTGSTVISGIKTIPLSAGSVLQLFFEKPFNGHPQYFNAHFTVKIEKVNKETVDFQDGLGEFLISDFTKEVLNFFGLTMFPEENSNDLTYKTIKERVRSNEIVDWSDKYIERTSEEYIATNYAQRNFFQYQYNDKEGSYYDGYIDVSNMNIDATKTVFKSKTYAPERVKTKFRLNSTTEIDSDVFKFYDKQPNDNPNNPPSYKGLEKRFYFIRQATGTYNVTIGSNATNEQQNITNAVAGNFAGLDWQNILGKYYGDYVSILNDSRLHIIDLDLDIVDAIQLDFKKLYYFKQEQQYYLLNKLNFDEKKATGEFVRVKRSTNSDLITIGATIAWIDGNIGSTTTWSHYMAVATITGNPTYLWQTRFNNGPWVDATPNVLNYDYQFGFGVNDLRISYTNGAVSGFSNILTYERKIEQDPDKCYRFDFTSLQALPRTIEWVTLNGQIASTVLNFSSPTDVQSLNAKSIISMGGATLINQTIIPCPAIVCKIYRTTRFLGSGDDLWIDYVDCNGITQYETQYGFGTGQWYEFNRCAREGTVSTNGTLTEEGSC
ncbi:hypothetical protein [Chryseobacterium daeguense]|uniref:hypothetical protein n=1 Tax=Chryseobacterium daeguense TaxID=412438 RepID=UPI00041D0AC2|nr:hypothetical protein [Chryseobacterium daeguense]